MESLGGSILAFYRALNHLSLRKGNDWAKAWLDMGKPSWLLDYARMNFSKQHLPRLLRPDLILGHDSFWVTELDSVPGGAGSTAVKMQAYRALGYKVTGNEMPADFADVVTELAGKADWNLAIIVSDESEDYRPEMTAMADELRSRGHNAWQVHPRDVAFDEDGLWLDVDDRRIKVDVVWRFYELFDLRNIPKSELVMYSGKRKNVVVSPPYKPFLEEKLALALLKHPSLETFWKQEMGEHFVVLSGIVPDTWVMDPTPVPHHAEISGLKFRGAPLRDFRDLADATQKERRLVVKPSGYSPLSWGSRGVVVGHDVSQEEWAVAVHNALDVFHQTPHILQDFKEGKRVKTDYWDPRTGKSGDMSGRARLTPYYYVIGDEARLSGILATIVPDDKKMIHGMTDAVMTVCAEGRLPGV